MRKKIWALSFWLLILSVSGGAEISWLRVAGSQIRNEQGERVILRGLGGNISWVKGGYSSVLRLSEDELLKQSLECGYNSFRLGINFCSQSTWENFDQLLPHLDKFIEKCEQEGIYLILDAHFMPGFIPGWCPWEPSEKFFDDPQLQERFKKIWEKISSRYANRPIIAIYELINEPVCDSGKKLRSFFADCVRSIRTNDRRHIIALAQNTACCWMAVRWAGWLDAWKDGPLEDPNCIYTLHAYPVSYTVKRDLKIEPSLFWLFPDDGANVQLNYAKNWSRRWDTCIWVSEFAPSGGGATKKPEVFLNAFIDNLDSLGWSAHFWGNPRRYGGIVRKIVEEKLPVSKFNR